MGSGSVTSTFTINCWPTGVSELARHRSRILTDGDGKSAGVNATWLAQLYPVRPLVVRLEADAGNLGSAVFLQGQASAGLVWKHFEAYAGLDHMQIADIVYDSWFAGLRVHL